MIVWYKRRKTWKKWPANDEVETDLIYYYRDKGNKQLITTTKPELTMQERKATIEEIVKQKVDLIRAGRKIPQRNASL